jgi:hypothetical protein
MNLRSMMIWSILLPQSVISGIHAVLLLYITLPAYASIVVVQFGAGRDGAAPRHVKLIQSRTSEVKPHETTKPRAVQIVNVQFSHPT